MAEPGSPLAPSLCVDAISAAGRWHTGYVPLSAFPPSILPAARRASAFSGIPLDHLMVTADADAADPGEAAAEDGVSALALAALGGDARDEPLFFVRSGPLRDAMVAELAGLVHRFRWKGDDMGLTHLEELGGILVLDLIGWAVPAGATVLICDEPLYADARAGGARFSAVALRLRRGSGPLQVLDCGEGAPAGAADSAGHLFTGRGPCDAWLAAHRALAAGQVTAGDTLLLHTKGPRREGWLTLRATDPARLRLPAPA
ncbi:hypothetical protein [Streptomyces aidingensis]|uniref:Uncharacterized protein n=1 Tax=Streptomyces aidingensis TaxID=910347 RepID=A0A1I1MS89_9ACTN|nr:hypothetical protein [Streptomyces aidingensis]SFC88307.1 hypothetical protein SAMN05421773_10739 [Streptomyces aidingensis]